MVPCAPQASTWEHLAVLNEEQERAVDLISQHCAERPLPEHVNVAKHTVAVPANMPSIVLASHLFPP